MTQTPIPVGLILCDHVLVEQGTKKISIIGSFRRVDVEQFPAKLPPFFLYAELTDGLGSGIMESVLSRLETDEQVFSYRTPIRFSDQLSVLRTRLRISNCTIPSSGAYQFMLLVDGMFVAQRQLQVFLRTDSP
jgi:hypothetical protein